MNEVRHRVAWSNNRVASKLAGKEVGPRKRGRIATLIGLEGGHAVEENMTFTPTGPTRGVSHPAAPYHNDLSDFGKEVVREMNRLGTMADISHVADIDPVFKVAEVDAAGIGGDFDAIEYVPAGLEDVSKFPRLTRALLAKGYSPADIQKIYGRNTLRLMRTVRTGSKVFPVTLMKHTICSHRYFLRQAKAPLGGGST